LVRPVGLTSLAAAALIRVALLRALILALLLELRAAVLLLVGITPGPAGAAVHP